MQQIQASKQVVVKKVADSQHHKKTPYAMMSTVPFKRSFQKMHSNLICPGAEGS